MKKSIFILFVVFSAFSLQAQKVAYVNSQAIIAELPEVKEANATIETLKAQLMKKGQDMVKALQTKGQKLEQGRDGMAPIKFQEEVEKLKKEEEEIVQFEEQSQFRIYQKTEELLGPVQKKINEAIKAVAIEKGYSYIFDAQGSNILYADESVNVSELVKAKMKS
ncbi:MAG TPA: OmpH family outer membrane protein [Saprospiraceae bacterium]|nr:OmpH family outer membrane protein [Saprospiraceae bacterium]